MEQVHDSFQFTHTTPSGDSLYTLIHVLWTRCSADGEGAKVKTAHRQVQFVYCTSREEPLGEHVGPHCLWYILPFCKNSFFDEVIQHYLPPADGTADNFSQ